MVQESGGRAHRAGYGGRGGCRCPRASSAGEVAGLWGTAAPPPPTMPPLGEVRPHPFRGRPAVAARALRPAGGQLASAAARCGRGAPCTAPAGLVGALCPVAPVRSGGAVHWGSAGPGWEGARPCHTEVARPGSACSDRDGTCRCRSCFGPCPRCGCLLLGDLPLFRVPFSEENSWEFPQLLSAAVSTAGQRWGGSVIVHS